MAVRGLGDRRATLARVEGAKGAVANTATNLLGLFDLQIVRLRGADAEKTLYRAVMPKHEARLRLDVAVREGGTHTRQASVRGGGDRQERPEKEGPNHREGDQDLTAVTMDHCITSKVIEGSARQVINPTLHVRLGMSETT